MAELEAEEPPARPEHASRLRQRRWDVGHVPQPEGDGVEVDAAVGQRQRLGRTADPAQAATVALACATRAFTLAVHALGVANTVAADQAAIDRPVATDLQHRFVDVADDDVDAAARQPEGDVARAAGDVDAGLAGPRRDVGDEGVLP